MAKLGTILASPPWRSAPAALARQSGAAGAPAARRLEIGQRFYRTGLPSVVWRVARVYQDGQGLEHAILVSNSRNLDPKTLSAAVLLDSRQYRSVQG